MGAIEKKHMAVLLLSSTLLAGCGSLVRTEYSRPQLELPAAWSYAPVSGEQALASEQWWRAFQDEALNSLIERALQSNSDMALAALKVRQAQLRAGIANGNLTPDVNAKLSASRERNFDAHTSRNAFSTSLGLSYEVDLWGKLSSARDKAHWEAMATEQDRVGAALALIGTTANLYWRLAYLNESIAASEASLDYTAKALKLAQVKHRSGAVSNLDLIQAEQNLASQRASLTDLWQKKVVAQNALAILFDQAPENTVPDPQTLPVMAMPALPVATPAALLARRPDMQAAEMRLRSVLADTDYTRASYYPSFSLTGSLATGESNLADILRNPVASLGAGLTLPFLQWRQTQLNIKVSEAAYEQAVIAFRQKLYSALAEVENKLSARTQLMAQEAALRASLTLASEAERLSEVRYRSGATDVQAWLDQQETRRKAQLQLTDNRLAQLQNMMALYQALGGGFAKPWEPG
ncbi:efflux transporter outer membrane subunit [Spartinivicinus poritis]|uniref:Efflux transporter outer membrane subunit n=1 Tax=Spartinivicinus poritis TaxID=2994640 RepID=A0ABT5U6X1_9GAMM|nr:efflux transporter outer membrane subunit [Spartinivicinus sp. A2-2]MDE1462111.1 efflux transporter outer membrane subunit [Spartinivicinus sp. A2-2]